MKKYLDEGAPKHYPVEEEDEIFEEVHPDRYHPLKPLQPKGRYLSVDASSYALLRANNWRIGVSRCAYVVVQTEGGRLNVEEEGSEDHLFAVVGSPKSRAFEIWAQLRRFESDLVLKLEPRFDRRDVYLMDGAAYFGGEQNFSINLYHASKRRGITLLMMPKTSPKLRDSRGRDLLASVGRGGLKLQSRGQLAESWVYYPLGKRESQSRHLYADISCVKLSPSSPRVFRCDIVDYLLEGRDSSQAVEIVSQLAYLARDARCDGYPAPLFLAHQQTKIPEAKLLEYEEMLYTGLEEEGLLEDLLTEVEAASFRRHLLGLRHDYELVERMEGW